MTHLCRVLLLNQMFPEYLQVQYHLGQLSLLLDNAVRREDSLQCGSAVLPLAGIDDSRGSLCRWCGVVRNAATKK